MGDFELQYVLDFMLSKGGKVRNHELVTHFKNFLNHPNHKAQNREKFKDFVNELASIKLDDTGEKVLILKRKYRSNSDGFTSASNLSTASTTSLSTTSGSSVSAATPRAAGEHPASRPSVTTSQPSLDVSAPREASSVPGNQAAPVEDARINERFKQEQQQFERARSEPPVASPRQANEGDMDSLDGAAMSRTKVDEAMEVVQMRHTDRVQSSTASSLVSLNSIDSQMSATSATSSGTKTSTDEDVNASVISVRDKIKNLNKQITSEADVVTRGRQDGGHHKKWSRPIANDDDDDVSHSSSSSYVTLNAEQKEWMVVSSFSEYHDMNRLLSKNPHLAKLKDFTNGFTALHWAAKAGKPEVIKLIANKPNVNIDQRSHGGYTALHLAAIHGHESIIELLVQTYKADANLRDYSGKKAKQYLKNSASSKAQQLLVSRRLGSDIHPVSLDDSFIRSSSMRMSNRAKAISSLMQSSVLSRQNLLRASWAGSHENIMEEDDQNSPRPSRSEENSPASGRKHSSADCELMPPPSGAKLARHLRHSERVSSSSRERLYSPRFKHKTRHNDENQNIARSESEPDFKHDPNTKKDSIV